MPPETIRDLGPEAQALYGCLGVSDFDLDGRLVCCPVRSRPRVNRFRLRLGDVVVLCTDGLVEEGVFLAPSDLVLLSQEGLPAVELARTFVAAARARHRDASPWEPDGCGDDVTCIVLKRRMKDEGRKEERRETEDTGRRLS
jgi:serine/threonine protein phosphatase PrpC